MNKEVAVEISYTMPSANSRTGGGANGAGGFTWIDPRAAQPTRKVGFWTQGETNTNSSWVPCYDFPNDKCTSETHTTVPEDWTVIGNGAETPSTLNADAHTRTFHWTMKQPHSTYLLSLVGRRNGRAKRYVARRSPVLCRAQRHGKPDSQRVRQHARYAQLVFRQSGRQVSLAQVRAVLPCSIFPAAWKTSARPRWARSA